MLTFPRNPWGEAEWRGRWSDGSPEWNADSLAALNHKFGDDGMFWISFEDLLRKYQFFDRTRLFDSSWKVSQQWTTVDVPWSADYNDTKFSITLTEASCVVIVLSQLDERYWTGLEGQYRFTLHFRLNKDGDETFTVRSHGNYWMNRSVSTELDLEAGNYSVLMKITATRDPSAEPIEEVVREICKRNQEKLLQYGLAYDLAHAKGIIVETEEEKRLESEYEAKKKNESKQKAVESAKKDKYKKWLLKKKEIERTKREKARKEEHLKKKQAQRAAEATNKESETKLKTPMDVDGAKLPLAAIPEMPQESISPMEAPNENSGMEPQAIPTAGSPEGSRIGDDTVLVDKEHATSGSAESKMSDFNQEPVLQNTGPVVPALKINDEETAKPPVFPPAPMSPGYPPSLAPPPDSDDAETVVSYASSIDTDLDLDYQSDVVSVVADDEPDPANEEFSNDPWNAVCVIGLRVYSKGSEVSVSVVRPKHGEGEEDTPLDVDDPSKGMSDEPTSPVKEEKLVESLDSVIAGIEKI